MAKCPICDGGGRITSLPSGMPVKCTRCNGTGEVMTEQEFIQTCDTEQLAEFIYDITCNCWGCKRIYVEDCPNYAKYKACFCNKEDVIEWLKQPHKDGES